ncbi:hypothetical protein GB931_04045 [Modestobacter sp. I12A-02628]|uniref:hypothetical protein n=1 Tax=Goekera deserti TaxID=2497753 RepID=UPI00128C3874|nr:hypothetical protein [Goekera deserti]MPQ97110.1 hypothetical protein [Goekera deserti]NDI46572.1 hypothetical protein [Goekera deserti]
MLVSATAIEDGQVRPPRVGAVVRLRLGFRESRYDEPDATVSTVRVRAETRSEPPQLPGRRSGTTGQPHWPTRLYGDAWQATWSAPRPVVGEVELRGTVVADLMTGGTVQPTRGRVTRVQVVDEALDCREPGDTRTVPALQRLREVEQAPRWFHRGVPWRDPARSSGWQPVDHAEPRTEETGVLVHLDLDDVPPAPLRPALVPGALDAHGPDLWVADERLPLVVHLRDRRLTTELRWPGAVLDPGRSRGRRLLADAAGCWLTGPDGVHRLGPDGSVRQVSDTPVWTSAAAAGTLATHLPQRPGDPLGPHVLRLWSPAGTTLDLPPAQWTLRSLVSARGGFLVLVSGPPDGTGLVRLLSLDTAGGMLHGPPLTTPWHGLLLVGGAGPLLVDETGQRPVHADLTLGRALTGAGRPRVLAGWAAGRRRWTLSHTPDGSDPPADPDVDRWWLLTELDPQDGRPVARAAVDAVPAAVTADSTGPLWLVGGRVLAWPATDGAPGIPLDVAAPPTGVAGDSTTPDC